VKINITGIRKLHDGTVTFTGTTAKENYLPLVILDNDGKDIHLTTEQSKVSEDTASLIAYIQKLRADAYEQGRQSVVQGNLLTEKEEKGNE